MKKVCFVTGRFPPDFGGLSNAAKRVSCFLKELGFEVHIVTVTSASVPEVDTETRLHRIPVGGSDSDQSRSIAQYLWQLDQQEHFDLFHAFWFPMAFPCSLVAGPRRPLITSIRGSDAHIWSESSKLALTRNILTRIQMLTTVNRALLQKLLTVAGRSPASKFIGNSVAASKSRWSLDGCVRGRVGTVGHFQPVKGIGSLVEAYAAVPILLRSGLHLIGDFPDEGSRLITMPHFDLLAEGDWNVSGLLKGTILEMEVLRLNVFVLSSTSEGFPNALLEAAALGVPLVSTAFPGVEDYVEDGRHALMVPVGDTHSLTRAITQVLSDPKLATRLSAGALELAAIHSPEKEKAAWAEVYQKL